MYYQNTLSCIYIKTLYERQYQNADRLHKLLCHRWSGLILYIKHIPKLTCLTIPLCQCWVALPLDGWDMIIASAHVQLQRMLQYAKTLFFVCGLALIRPRGLTWNSVNIFIRLIGINQFQINVGVYNTIDPLPFCVLKIMDGRKRISSLPLQVVLYFNGWYLVLFYIAEFALIIYKGA